MQVLNLSALIALMFGAAVSFVFVVLLFIRVAGDAGKALAMLLLALQISASGGVVPIELSGEFFSALSPLLPMTWLVQGLKAAMFGAYGGDWWHPLQLTLLLGGAVRSWPSFWGVGTMCAPAACDLHWMFKGHFNQVVVGQRFRC
ncbi:MAG: hypothetical protein QM527_05820 [Alphaproteobacteria bacterium]|nr:hypothetical protein [Alphaproteobacteria bacterium]